MEDPVQDKVHAIIARISGTKKPLLATTSINFDLPIDGDDAYELLTAIKNEFKTNFDGFHFYRYFRDEGAIWFKSPYAKKEKDNLTVQQLIDVVKRGTWLD